MPDTSFLKEVTTRSNKVVTRWYGKNIMRVLEVAKSKHARDIDKTIKLGKELVAVLEKVPDPPKEVIPRLVQPLDTLETMKPVDPDVKDILMKSVVKGGTDKYLNKRYKNLPEDRFYFRACSSWDYGWQQKSCRMKPFEKHFGRRRVIVESFYRDNNVGPDHGHYRIPDMSTISICDLFE